MSRGTIWSVAVIAVLAIVTASFAAVEDPAETGQWVELAAPIMPWLLLVAAGWVVVSWLGGAI